MSKPNTSGDLRRLFPSLDGNAMLWVWLSDRPLTPGEQTVLSDRLSSFTASWSSHGRPVHSSVALIEDRLLLIGGALHDGDVSGCGIDKSVHILEQVASEAGYRWVDGMTVAFKRDADSQIECATRAEFKVLAQRGDVTGDALVYDRAPVTVGAARAHGLVRRASDTWTARFFDSTLPEEAQ